MAATRVVLVGAGGFGRCWWGVLAGRRDVQLVAVVEPDPDARAEAASFFGLPCARAIAGDRDPAWLDVPADAVVDCSPPWHHLSHGLAAIQRGRHFLVAKPMATTMADACRLEAAARASGVIVAVAQQMRYFSCFATLRRLLRDRVVGDPLLTEVRMALDGRGWKPGTAWRMQMAQPVLMEAGVHHLDLIRWCLADEFSVLSLNSWRAPGSPFSGRDCVSAHLVGGRGSRVCYQASFGPDPQVPIRFDSGWDVHCEKGSIRVRDGSVTLLPEAAPAKQLTAPEAVPQPLEDLNEALFGDFAVAMRSGVEPHFGGTDNLKTMRLLMECLSHAEAVDS
jgi:predicted dehydrogenase